MLISDFLFVLVMVLGIGVSLSSSSWLFMWVGMEMSLIGFVPIICGNSVFSRGGTGASESAMKYFVVQAVGSSLLLFGGFSVFSASKMWDLGLLSDSAGYMLYIGPLFIVFGLGVKLGVFPFHFWVPSVMGGMSWFGCMVLTSLQKVVPVFFLCVLLSLWGGDLTVKLVLLSSIGSSFVGGLGGINQTEVRAIMAYSSINHMGWLLMCVCGGAGVVLFYLLFYVLMSAGFFLILWVLGGDSVGQINVVGVGASGFERIFIVGAILSYMGMPPFLGFGVKWFAMSSFLGVFGSGVFPFFYFFLMFLGSLLSLSYYLMIFVALVMGSGSAFMKKGSSVVGLSWGWVLIVVLVFVGSFLGGLELIFGSISDYMFI